MATPRKKAERPSKKADAASKGPPKGMAAFPEDLAGAVRYGEPLGRHTTYRIGGPAAIHFAPASNEAVAGAVAWAREHKVPYLVLGLGSNVLIRDGGFKGLVIKIGKGLDVLTHRAGDLEGRRRASRCRCWRGRRRRRASPACTSWSASRARWAARSS